MSIIALFNNRISACTRFRTVNLLGLVFLASCSFSSINVKNSLLEPDASDDQIAKVYFIRPEPFKHKGISDNEIAVDLNNELLLKINEGQYTMVKIKPSKVHVVTHSKTAFTNKFEPIDVARTREYQFLAGKTYFIHLQRINEEFRGIYYDPTPVDLQQAKQLCEHLSAIGAASDYPIKSITTVAEGPQPGPLEPALPENLYPGKPYLIKQDPDYKSHAVQQQSNEPSQDNSQDTSKDKPQDSLQDKSKDSTSTVPATP